MELGLKGKRVFITGSGRGIGLATAEGFLREGASVVINSRHEDALIKSIQFLEKQCAGNVSYIEADIMSPSGVSKACKFIDEHFGALDVFVANLGSGKPEKENSLDVMELQRFYEINVLCYSFWKVKC